VSKTETSPCVNTGTKEKRIALTRAELIHILFQYEKEVKDIDDFSPFLDEVFNGQVGVIVFDPRGKAGERFKDDGLSQSLASELRNFNLGKGGGMTCPR
jgi:hypothetical protein